MNIAVIGISHHLAPIQIRERIAYREAELPSVVKKLQARSGAQETVLLSTCNRVEVYLSTVNPPLPLESVCRFFEEDRGAAGIAEWFYAREGLEAVRHLFRVTSGLDSMVLGENEILGQVKRAYLAALQARTTGRTLNRIFQVALRVGKTVRSVTSISSGQLSVPSVAVGLAEKIFQDLARRRGLVLGAGETGELTAATFRNRGMRSFVVLNRTLENARRLAEKIGGEPDSLEALPRRMIEADVLISCADAGGGGSGAAFLVSLEHARQAAAARRGMPLLIVDIAVPRSVDPAIDGLENVYLYNIDDLQSIAAENAARRAGEVGRCEAIIRREADKILCAAIAANPLEAIARLRNHCNEIADEELRRAIRDLDTAGATQRESLEGMVRRIITKILHRPSQGLKEGGEGTAVAETLRRLLDLR